MSDPDFALAVFRGQAWDVADLSPHLASLQAATGEDFAVVAAVARNSLIYQSGVDHRETRRAIAPFLSPAELARWQPAIDAAIESGMARLAASTAPDLVHDFAQPVFVACISALMGVAIEDEAAFLRAIAAAREIAEPLMPLRRLREAQAGLTYLIELFARPLPTPTSSPPTLPEALATRTFPEGLNPGLLAVSLVVAAHTAAESLSLALSGLLREGPAAWQATSAPGWAEERLEDVIRAYPSTLNLYRVARQAGTVGGCPAARGDVAVLDVSAINRAIGKIRDGCPDARGPRSLSFGDGAHKCPGAALARLLLGRALPAMATRFPFLQLREEGVRIVRTAMVQAPHDLPCTGVGIRRATTRLWQIGDHEVARIIATDDARFGPPDMTAHLGALAAASGQDLSVAIRVARNAPFFLSGPRQHAIRLATLQVIGNNRLTAWTGFIDATITRLLDGLDACKTPDLVHDFCDPLFRDVTRAVLGIHPRDLDTFDAAAPQLQELLEPLLSLRAVTRVQAVCATLLDEIAAGEGDAPDDLPPSLLARLHADAPEGCDAADRRALVLVLYGASFNVAHTLANALNTIGRLPPDARRAIVDARGSSWLDGQVLPEAASPRFIYRLARDDGEIGAFRYARGDTMQLQLAEINRGRGASHLALGHGLHRCLGAGLARLMLARAVPALLTRFPDFAPIGEPSFADNPQTIVMSALPATMLPRSPSNSSIATQAAS